MLQAIQIHSKVTGYLLDTILIEDSPKQTYEKWIKLKEQEKPPKYWQDDSSYTLLEVKTLK